MLTRGRSRKIGSSRVISPIIHELERWHGIFNRSLFQAALRPAAITPQPAGPKRAQLQGWYCARLWRNGASPVDEINICAESLRRKAEDILETLLHEMVHQVNAQAGVQDVTANSQYHNGRFRKAAEAAGLVCEYRGRVGWGITCWGELGRSVLRKHRIRRQVFTVARVAVAPASRSPRRWRRWNCLCGPIRVPRQIFSALCLLCGSEFVSPDAGQGEGESGDFIRATGSGR